MNEALRRSELLNGLDESFSTKLLSITRTRSLDAGEYLFLLGDPANQLYVVLDGGIEICFPFSFGGELKDIAVESKEPGSALGWSAFVKPYRFTLSARAAKPTTVAAFPRRELERLMEADCRLGLAFTGRIAEIVGDRLLKIQALWARELQRTLAGGIPPARAGVGSERRTTGGSDR